MVLAYNVIDGGGAPVLDLTDVNVVISNTSGTLNITAVGGSGATSYKYRYALQSDNILLATLYTSASSSFSITGLTPGSTYKVVVTAYGSGGTYGNSLMKEYIYIPIQSNTAGTANELPEDTNNEYKETATGSSKIESSKSTFFKLSNTSTNKSEYSVVYKSFTEIPTNETYYAFGTTIVTDSVNSVPSQVGGIGFFVDNQGTTGYFLRLRASASKTIQSNNNEVEIVKLINGNDIALQDSQKTKVTTASGIYAGQTYKIDIKVKVEASKITITAYINGFKIIATDTLPSPVTSIYQNLVSRTNNVAMFVGSGTINFDYIYGMAITERQYNDESLFNIYTGQFSNNQIEFLYGERMLDLNSSVTPTKGRVEEFGTIAREIRKFEFKFSDRPAVPIAPTTGANDFIKIIGSKVTNFGAETYILNNSGFSAEVGSDTDSAFAIYGYSISQTGELQYDNFDKNLYTSEEPIVFNTQWLQNERDVIKLADWIKSQWSKKQTIITLEIFGNPLLQVGDIIKIDYPYHGLTTSQKFIILSISNSYQTGLSTSIVCRSIT